jgi:hypothetical protein
MHIILYDIKYKLTISIYTGGPSRGYQQGNSYVYNNRSYKSNTNTSNEYSRISRQT